MKTTDDANLRPAPSLATTPVGVVPEGTTVYPTGQATVTAEGHTWRQVALGPVGWIADELLTTGEVRPVGPTTTLSFNPDEPVYLQRNPWTCSIGATIWCLRSVGIDVTPGEAHDAMSPQYVNADVGLLDASGAGIVRVLRDHWGVEAYNLGAADFDRVAHLAGTYAIALGLRNWGMPGGHWSGVRRFDGAQIILANPAGTGPRFGQQALTREQFNARGPASIVVLTGRT